MNIFLSHISSKKPTVDKIVAGLPRQIKFWLDQEKLLVGDDLYTSFKKAITSEVDYVLLFWDKEAARNKSEWVAQEIKWALEKEKELGRKFLLPIEVDGGAFDSIKGVLGERKCLQLRGYEDTYFDALSKEIVSELLALTCRDLHEAPEPVPDTTLEAVSKAEAKLTQTASLIREVVFDYRSDEKIAIGDLRDKVNAASPETISDQDFKLLLEKIVKYKLIAGLIFDGDELYLSEEHAQWKSEHNRELKEIVAREAVKLIKGNMKVLIDAGSTTEKIIDEICSYISNQRLSNITIATPSIHNANVISEFCTGEGYIDGFSPIKLLVPGGQVRPVTQAIVGLSPEHSPISEIVKHSGRFDLGIVGVNGVHISKGFTTKENSEALNKKEILKFSRQTLIVCDSSKVGKSVGPKFASFEDEIKLIVNKDEKDEKKNAVLTELHNSYPDKVVLV